MSNIYLVPQTFPCPVCTFKIATITIIKSKVVCPNCNKTILPSEYGKFFGMITDIKDNE